MTDLRNTDNENVFFEVIAQALSKAQDDAKANKSVLLKLSTKDIAALRREDAHRLSSQQFSKLAELVLECDPNMRFMHQVAAAVVNHSKANMAEALIEEVARLITVWFTNAEAAQKQTIFFSLMGGVNKVKSPQRFIDILDSQVKMRCKVLSEREAGNPGDDQKTSPIYDESSLLKNLRAIGLQWLLVKGLCSGELIIDYLISQNSVDIEITPEKLNQLGLYLTENTVPNRNVNLLALLKHLKLQQEAQQSAHSLEVARRTQAEKAVLSEQQKLSESKAQNAALSEKVAELEAALSAMQQQLEEQQALGKAERVHLKDDHGKIKYKTLNRLQDDVLPLLEKTTHALDKEVPKVHVAMHQLELITEEVAGMIEWLKK
tara:strand:- start:10713 stop:11840 length:1128 start_codon:yes stop_codon:yes gene_type:complete